MIKKIVLWILVLVCMGTIFNFSSQVSAESKKTSSKIVKKIVENINVEEKLTESQTKAFIKTITIIVRKSAHFAIYALLGLLIFLLLREYNTVPKKAVIIAVILSMLYACSDEFHQCFVEGRSGRIIDVIIDTCGAFAGNMLAVAIGKITDKFKAESRRKHSELQGNL